MKNYKTIDKEINAKAEELRSIKNQIDEKNQALSTKGMTITEIKKMIEDETVRETRKAKHAEIDSLEREREVIEIELEMMKNNYIISLVNSEMPKAVAIINKYVGKRLGEKTEKKIREEIEEKTDIKYIVINSADISFSIKGVNERYQFGGMRDDFRLLSDDNRIREFEIDENCFIYSISNDYIDNPRKAAERAIKLKEKAEKQLEQLRETISEYNKLARGKMHSYYASMR